MRETSKAHIRRMKEADAGLFPWREIFVGDGVDVGSGDDPLTKHLLNVTTFDLKDGDANQLSKYFPPGRFDWLHASNVAEHMHAPVACIYEWLTVVKRGGHLVMTVPSMELYGDMLWKKGPRYNDDHKSTWSIWMKGSPAPIHVYVQTFVKGIEDSGVAKPRLTRLVDTNYDYRVMFTRDQTFRYEDGVECFIEIVMEKL